MKVIITGASKGIGLAIAQKFAQQGSDLILCARNMDITASWQASMMERYNTCIEAFSVDLTDTKALHQFAHQVLEQHGAPDILVNNAGSFTPGSIHNEPKGALEAMMAVNLYSAYHLTRQLLPSMMQSRSGHIFNICSIASLGAYRDGGAYSISKWAMLGFSRNLREEMKPYGIRVTSVLPGATWTDSWAGSGVEPGRIMLPEDIAHQVWAATQLSPKACVEDIIIRPLLGDL